MDELVKRVENIIDFCWHNFSAKVGGGLIRINKEASMQLHFAYVLKNTVDLAIHHKNEKVSIELETTIQIDGRTRECDIVVKIEKDADIKYLPIEMKCYREYASSGGKRGALDIFVKDVYVDIELLEAYSKKGDFLSGILLVMTDLRRVVYPVIRTGKYWNYDISDGTQILGTIIKNTPIGGYEVNVSIDGNYHFNWKEYSNFYFLKLENNL